MQEQTKTLTKIEDFIFNKYCEIYDSNPIKNDEIFNEIQTLEIKDLNQETADFEIEEDKSSEDHYFEIEALIQEYENTELLKEQENLIEFEKIEQIEEDAEIEKIESVIDLDFSESLNQMELINIELKEKQEKINLTFQNFKKELGTSDLEEIEKDFIDFKNLLTEYEEKNSKLKTEGFEFDFSFLNYLVFFREITEKNIHLLKSFFELLGSKNKLLEFFNLNKNNLEKEIEENIEIINKEKKVIEDINKLKLKDLTNEEYYNDLTNNKESYIKELEYYNKMEKELIELNIKNLLDEIKEIEIKIKEFNFSF